MHWHTSEKLESSGQAKGAVSQRRLRLQTWVMSLSVIATSVTLASILPQPVSRVASPFETSDLNSTAELFGAIWEATWSASIFDRINRAPSVSSGAVSLLGQQDGDAREANVVSNLPVRTDWGSELRGLVQEPLIAPLLQHLPPPLLIRGTTAGSFDVRLAYRAGTIEQSLFEDGRKAGLSDPLILRLAEIFGWDVDFALDVGDGDRFVVIYEEKLWFGRRIGDGEIQAAEFTNRNKTYRAIGFRDKFGRMNYYTPAGKSLQRPFLRSPVQFSNVSSQFSPARYHPILKTWRAHTGIDYAAPVGTPVRATASGRLGSVGWNGGYGNTVTIRHGGAYSTLYAHLSRYRPGLQPGQKIEQGEVIGYVGQTGLATGPHLHYEFQVHGQHRDPLTFPFSDGQAVSASLRDDFFRTARVWITRLDLVGNQYVAIAGN